MCLYPKHQYKAIKEGVFQNKVLFYQEVVPAKGRLKQSIKHGTFNEFW